jgi:hypothetical protein
MFHSSPLAEQATLVSYSIGSATRLQTQTTSTRECENRSLFAWPFLGTENGYIFHLEHADLTPSA